MKVYDVVQVLFGNTPNYNEMPEHYKKERVVCTCKTRPLAQSMMRTYHAIMHSYKIVERNV